MRMHCLANEDVLKEREVRVIPLTVTTLDAQDKELVDRFLLALNLIMDIAIRVLRSDQKQQN